MIAMAVEVSGELCEVELAESLPAASDECLQSSRPRGLMNVTDWQLPPDRVNAPLPRTSDAVMLLVYCGYLSRPDRTEAVDAS